MNHEMALISQYYPNDIYGHFVPQPDEVKVVSNPKPRRRRRKNNKTDDDDDDDTMMIRKRKLSEEQVKILEKSFENEHKLETERKDKLAAELGLDPRQVAVWFQNRRARWKNKKLEDEYFQLKSKHESTIAEKCCIQNELSKLKERLVEAEKEIQRLSERWEFSSNSPTSSSFSMDHQEPQHFLKDFGMTTDLDILFQEKHVNGSQLWDNLYYM